MDNRLNIRTRPNRGFTSKHSSIEECLNPVGGIQKIGACETTSFSANIDLIVFLCTIEIEVF